MFARRRQITICREGWYYLVILWFILAGAMMREINLLLVLAGMMLGPLLLSWRMVVVTLRRLDVRRKLPEAISAGDLLVVDMTAANRRRRWDSWAVIVEDEVQRVDHPDSHEAGRARVLFARVRPGETGEAAYRGRLMRRGLYRFGPLKVSTRAPLGLLRGTRKIQQQGLLYVCPRLGSLSPRWLQAVQPDRVGSQRSRRRQGLMEGDYYGLRDWRSGDSRRWIHWRTSARRNQLAVRQFEQQRNQDLAILVDLCVDDAPGETALENVELAISFVATIVADQCRRGSSRLLVGIAGKQVENIRGISSMVLLQEVMQKLAAAQASSRDRLPQLLQSALAQVTSGTRTVIVSTRRTDLSDTDRFASAWDDPRKRAAIGRVACVDVSLHDFVQYFQLDAP